MPDKDSAAYARYVKWCKSVNQPWASFEVWLETTKRISTTDLATYMHHRGSEPKNQNEYR